MFSKKEKNITNYKELLVLSAITKEKEIFDYFNEGKITEVVIFTAYLDIQTLVDFRDFLNKNGQMRLPITKIAM